MNIISVKSEEHQGGIPLPSIEAVKGALQAFSEGRTAASHATRRQLSNDMGERGGMATGLMLLAQPDTGSFVGRLCEQMERTLRSRSNFSESFDYDGVGPFFKTSVDVQWLDDDTYLLMLNAAYVGNKVERGLAEYLGVQRGLWSTSVELTLDAIQGDQFVIDLDPIAQKLHEAGITSLRGETMAQIIAAGNKEEYLMNPGKVILLDGTDRRAATYGLAASLYFSSSSVDNYYHQPYGSRGPVITGPLRRGWEDKTKFEYPVVCISVHNDNKDKSYGDRVPVLSASAQTFMRQLAEAVEESFTS